MSTLQFDESQTNQSYKSRTVLGESRSPKMIKFILKTGIVKDEKKAGNLLLIISATCFILSALIAYAFIFDGFQVGRPALTPAEINKLKERRAVSEKIREDFLQNRAATQSTQQDEKAQ